MEAVTAAENNRRAHAKLTRDQVARIRTLLEGKQTSGITKTEIARQFGVAYMTITYIERRVTWPDVEPDEL